MNKFEKFYSAFVNQYGPDLLMRQADRSVYHCINEAFYRAYEKHKNKDRAACGYLLRLLRKKAGHDGELKKELLILFRFFAKEWIC